MDIVSIYLAAVHVMTTLGTVVLALLWTRARLSVCAAPAVAVGIEVVPKVVTNTFISANSDLMVTISGLSS
jgi:hypothetical protein